MIAAQIALTVVGERRKAAAEAMAGR